MSITNDLIPVPEAEDSTWEEWEKVSGWYETTIPGILMDEPSTDPVPLELLPVEKY